MPLKFARSLELRCPCQSKTEIREVSGQLLCSGQQCEHSQHGMGFSIIDDRAILVSISRSDTLLDPLIVQSRVERSSNKFSALRRYMGPDSRISEENCAAFIQLLSQKKKSPQVLMIGSAEPGVGTNALWSSHNVDIVGIDVYITDTVSMVCDAHYLPFPSGFFDGVWVQAVLEHVVDPQQVVAEITRVLDDGGLVYSEIPFMQQVHEGAYDFTRFTLSGHRYLFKNFETIKLDVLDGPGAAFSWSFRYWVWALTRSRNIARAANLVSSIVTKLLSRLETKESKFDSYSGSFFMGRKSIYTVKHKDLLSIYQGNIK